MPDDLDFSEGACGICHAVLADISRTGFMVETAEYPEGVRAWITDPSGDSVGEGSDITWAPAILEAEINAGFLDDEAADKISPFLTGRRDQIRVSEMSGYGRVVNTASMIISDIWSAGGSVEVRRDGPGIEVILYSAEGDEIVSAASGFCPVCAVNIAASRVPSIRRRMASRKSRNTGMEKYERGVTGRVAWRRNRIHVSLLENGEVIGRNWGCCIAYATVRAEIDAGFGSSKWNRIFKNYCDLCPLKHFWLGKSMGALGNRILQRMTRVGVREHVRMEDYITVDILSGDRRVGCGIGTLCSFSATVNALLRSDASLILKPDPADGFPYP
ncbi:conserved hypothetical protein [Methanothermobacter sp. CaT2]|uniref:Uncharacterized protein n=1 Tax=Methanothermobacter defluvii TaxID=49339 RepID=A0A371NBJ4_9EURY|nr:MULTISPECIES: hypothetical protein [Methanothermobacter]MBC7111084.1 hypothetical protein [Methanothermobacter sp.]REE26376.1 hypothetical protein C7452_1338 [Methanothermobacter defluvii]WBF07856.1 hypothetical protein ISG36_07565 [Methanothermobacter thermautotrophicus]BAM70677.1 conserved hypothetical protein [Methanothermobacter sp. CaT2]